MIDSDNQNTADNIDDRILDDSIILEDCCEELLEGEDVETTPSDEIYPDVEVRVERAFYSTSHLKNLVEKRKQLRIAPNFQRNRVWKVAQNSELIESILMGIPIPTIYLFESNDGTKQVVDGRQRISAIIDFLNGSFALRDLKILKKLNGLKFDSLDPVMQGKFEDYQLSVYIIQPPTPERIKYDIFDRVNRGGTQINKQEMRNALYMGEATKLVKELSQMDCFLTASDRGVSPRRAKDQYIILRALAFLLYYRYRDELNQLGNVKIEYRGDIDDFLSKILVFLNSNDEDVKRLRSVLKKDITQALDLASKQLGGDAFRFEAPAHGRRRAINMPLFEMLVYILSHPGAPNVLPSKLKTEVSKLKAEFDKQQMLMSNVDSTKNVNTRFEIADNLIKSIF